MSPDTNHLPDWLTFPGEQWDPITPRQAGLHPEAFAAAVAAVKVQAGGWGGTTPGPQEYGAALTRGGYLVQTWGDPTFKTPSASLGKCLTRALLGLTVEAGLVDPEEPIRHTWTGAGQLSHPHKHLDTGQHRSLTWRHLIDHYGGFVLESGYHWRRRELFHAELPEGVQWTGDPLFDNYAHTPPGAVERYSSGGYVRLGQALTALWGRDLKDVLDERLLTPLGIPADRWDWVPGQVVYNTRDWYPDFPGYGEYVDPPYEINRVVVRGGPGWVVMSPLDLARFGLLVATGGIWAGQRLLGGEWLRGHGGVDIHVVGGDPDTLVSVAKTNIRAFPFGQEIGWRGRFEFPRELVAGPVL
jgi:CubicO group peptidase (beta-lactamase class C family)